MPSWAVTTTLNGPLAEALLFGSLQNGGLVVLDVDGGKLVLKVSSTAIGEGKSDGKAAKGDGGDGAKEAADSPKTEARGRSPESK